MKMITCSKCKNSKPHEARGLCVSCYANWRYHNKKPTAPYRLNYGKKHYLDGGYIRETTGVNRFKRSHRIFIEKTFNRKLNKGEVVHHIDGDKGNNGIGNLMVFATVGMHIAFHKRQRAFAVTGNYDWLLCRYCRKYDSPKNLYVSSNGRSIHHRECMNLYSKKKYYRRKKRESD